MKAEDIIGLIELIVGSGEGYLAVATRNARNGTWSEQQIVWPSDQDQLAKVIERNLLTCDIYFCPTLLNAPKRIKDNIPTANTLWADLDTCNPNKLKVPPSLVFQTSQGRYQGYWLLKKTEHSSDVETINRRIAYAHADEGCDKSGWDLTQYLRVPGSANFKNKLNPYTVKPELDLCDPNLRYSLTDFDVYPEVSGFEAEDIPMPDEWSDESAEDILERIKLSVNPRVWALQTEVPEHDWSKNLWQLELLLLDAGLTLEETFIVCREAACNKYAREQLDEQLLWKEVCRAEAYLNADTKPVSVLEDAEEFALEEDSGSLLTNEERKACLRNPTFVEEYIDWAKSIGDAAWQYHQAGAFITLSALLAGPVRLPTSFGTLIPNIWFMILADTTLTRKTTAMDMAMDLLVEVDSEVVLATDGSIEGLMTALSTRPGRPSIFLRDEFSGLLESVTKKDYYAGMLETFTKLYDGKFQKKILRKETIEVREPVLIFFAGGIKERILELLDASHVSSGFLPRFLFITAESDVTKLKPLGPPTTETVGKRSELVDFLRELYNHYHPPTPPDATPFAVPPQWNAELTEKAWVRYNRIEAAMLQLGLDSSQPSLMTPTMDRLCKSGLKLSVLIAALRMEVKIQVTEDDIVRAFYYIEQWQPHTLHVLANMGRTNQERTIERVYTYIKANPGVPRSTVMRQHHLTARDTDNIIITLYQRGLISREKRGRGEHYAPTSL